MEIGIFVVAFNNSVFTERQIISLKKYIRNKFDLVYIDNSTTENNIKDVCIKHNMNYEKNTNQRYNEPSIDHSSTLNYIYNKHKDKYNTFMFLDHDIFLYDYLDFNDYIEYDFIGAKQERDTRIYLWPGCLIVNGNYDLNFLPLPGLDSGGGLTNLIKDKKVLFLEEKHEKNNDFNKSYYDFYSIIDNKWFHFVNGSNWNYTNDHQERIDSLFRIYDSLVK